MEREAVALLDGHFRLQDPGPHAVMLTGGHTPLAIYRTLEQTADRADDALWLLISDERHVPVESPENNFAKMRGIVEALGVEPSRVMRVHTELPLEKAADRYDAELRAFFDRGGQVTLGILGLGADGHVASLFDIEDLERGNGRYAIAVPRAEGPDRISVTPDLLRKVERLVFLVAGDEKAAIVRQLETDPASVIANRATQGIAGVELWYAPGTSE
jgi:6-phosphogluconolactonase